MTRVWALLIERGLPEGADLTLYWRHSAAIEAARAYLVGQLGGAPGDVLAAIEAYNASPEAGEHIVLSEVTFAGHPDFEGEVDMRVRCRLCGEPVVLEDPSDPLSYIHAFDANDWGDHTAEVDDETV
jgi:hypothetical protein